MFRGKFKYNDFKSYFVILFSSMFHNIYFPWIDFPNYIFISNKGYLRFGNYKLIMFTWIRDLNNLVKRWYIYIYIYRMADLEIIQNGKKYYYFGTRPYCSIVSLESSIRCYQTNNLVSHLHNFELFDFGFCRL